MRVFAPRFSPLSAYFPGLKAHPTRQEARRPVRTWILKKGRCCFSTSASFPRTVSNALGQSRTVSVVKRKAAQRFRREQPRVPRLDDGLTGFRHGAGQRINGRSLPREASRPSEVVWLPQHVPQPLSGSDFVLLRALTLNDLRRTVRQLFL